MDEEGTNFGGVVLRVKQRGLAARPLVAAVESLPFAPAPAAYDERGQCGRGRLSRAATLPGPDLRDEIRSIRDELGVNAVHRCQRAFNLGRSIVQPL